MRYITVTPKVFDALHQAGLLDRDPPTTLHQVHNATYGVDVGDGSGRVRCHLIDGEQMTITPVRLR